MARHASWKTQHWMLLQALRDLAEAGDTNGGQLGEALKLIPLEEDDVDTILGSLVDADALVFRSNGEFLVTEIGTTLLEHLTQKEIVQTTDFAALALSSTSRPQGARGLLQRAFRTL